ncbi:hypothetical protein D3C84_619980 [compost metagenome]
MPVRQGRTPRRLNRRPEGSGFALFGTNHRCIHGVGDDLAPHRAFRAAADQANAQALYAIVPQQVQSVSQPEGRAFDHGAAQIGFGQVGHGQPEQAAAGVGKRGDAFAVEKRQHAHALGTDRRVLYQFIELLDVEVQQFANHPGGIGQVHGADQRQPTAVG